MYTPPAFAEQRPEVILDLVESRPFGTLVTAASTDGTGRAGGDGAGSEPTAGALLATHMPFVVDRTRGAQGVLVGHLARVNPQSGHLAALAGGTREALVIFTGPDAYITPGWYPSKQEHGRAVPTWNYVAVHVYGTLRPFEDRSLLLAHLEALTDRHEADRHEADHAQRWALGDAPAEYVDRLLREIVGVEIEITRLEGTWKMSQNRPAADIAGVIQGLAASPAGSDREVGALVAERTPPSKRGG